MMGRLRTAVALLLMSATVACAPRATPWGTEDVAPSRLALGDERFHTADGLALPLRHWLPPTERFAQPQGVVLALHGFNDHAANAFGEAGRWLADHGIAVYAYDQRGFGGGPRTGEWAGEAALVADLRALVNHLHARHPGVPVTLLGESMGGAVVMAALASDDPPDVAGAVLAAPAVWGRSTLPLAHRLLLEVMVRIAPAWALSGRNLGVWPSDNFEMLGALGQDPLVLKKTRIDALYGLTGLMDEAYRLGRQGALDVPVLWLYGTRDEIIPPRQTLTAARGLDPAQGQRFVAYPQGYHMLLRDLQGETVLRDILAWLRDPDGPLPSGLTVDPHAIDIPAAPRPGQRAPGRIEPRRG